MHSKSIDASCVYYQRDQLYVEEVALSELAEQFGTPLYIYSRASLENNWRAFSGAFSSIRHRICYAVKANSNLALLHLLQQMGANFDIVSLGELERVIAAGGKAQTIIFSGVGKTEREIKEAIQKSIYCFNIESRSELQRVQQLATKLQTPVKIALRVNPHVDANTHMHITTGLYDNKFGIESTEVIEITKNWQSHPYVQLIGIACHIGSQITTLKPFQEALSHLITLYNTIKSFNIPLQFINLGGGLGVCYQHEHPPTFAAYAKTLLEQLHPLNTELILEPGRAIVAQAGILLTRVEYIKKNPHKNFAITDAGMNDLIRPALYDAWQNILPVHKQQGEEILYDVVGPVCESADFLGKDRPLVIQENDLLVIDTVGAYGFSMSSNYNSRLRPAEVLVDGKDAYLIRKREAYADLFAHENIPATVLLPSS